MRQDQHIEHLNLPMIHIENKRKDIHGAPIVISPATASKLPDPVQPSIFYMEAVLPVQLKSAGKTLHFSASSLVKNILPPPFSKPLSLSSVLYPSASESSPASSSISFYSTTEDEAGDEPSPELVKDDIYEALLFENPHLFAYRRKAFSLHSSRLPTEIQRPKQHEEAFAGACELTY
ncbi:hypothetical protein [Parasitella parasitica]|uniref:Uncharacterized protein n=1 Tax=Parasitella parasitica TaxID=35722 RepID=A0A0B7NKW0_9FUNG|nr:hypothetical protein [Parasitella parasitica]